MAFSFFALVRVIMVNALKREQGMLLLYYSLRRQVCSMAGRGRRKRPHEGHKPYCILHRQASSRTGRRKRPHPSSHPHPPLREIGKYDDYVGASEPIVEGLVILTHEQAQQVGCNALPYIRKCHVLPHLRFPDE